MEGMMDAMIDAWTEPLVGKGPLRGQGDKYSLHAVQVRTGKYPACS